MGFEQYIDKINKFGEYCPKCGATDPDCNQACGQIYDILIGEVDDEIVKHGAELMINDCGNGKCGNVLNNYLKLLKYVK